MGGKEAITHRREKIYRKKQNQVEFLFESLKETVEETEWKKTFKASEALSPGSYQTVLERWIRKTDEGRMGM